jgi:hypothetical protein
MKLVDRCPKTRQKTILSVCAECSRLFAFTVDNQVVCRAVNKMNAVKVVVDGITFASKKEERYYQDLQLRKEIGDIKDFEHQPERFVLLDKTKHNGKTIRQITYRPDFKIIHNDGTEEYVDTKGHRTQQYIIRKKLLLARYPEINFREV